MNNPRFYVVIPTYNRAQLLRACLESIFIQTYRNFEVIVVDDGSTDDTPAVLAQYKDRVHTIRQVNQGQATARNTGIDAARGDYIAFLDCDDVWFPWTLETFNAVIEAHDRPAVIMGQPLSFHDDSELKETKPELLETSSFADFLTANSNSEGFVGSCAMVIQRQALDQQVRFSNVRMNGEDLDLLMKLCTARGFAWVRKPYTLGYRQHGANSVQNHASTAAGMKFLIKQERRGAYPGGEIRALERRHLILGWTRWWQHRAIDRGDLWMACQLYLALLPWLWQSRSYNEIWEFPAFIAWRPAGRFKRWLLSIFSRQRKA